MSFKILYVTPIYCLLFCACLSGYNLEAQDQSSTSQTETANGYLNSGIEKMNRGALEEAILDFDKAIEIDPQDARAHHSRTLLEIIKINSNCHESLMANS